MPRVPVYENFQATPTVAAPQFDAPRGPTAGQVAGEQAMHAGEAMMGAGTALAKIQRDQQDEQNQIRVMDAMNQVMAEKLRLTYDPQAGYIMLRGEAALKPDADGNAPEQTYIKQMGTRVDEAAQSLGNDQQRAMFRHQANQAVLQFQAGLVQHVAKEGTEYGINTMQGTTKLAQDQMGIAWGDAAAVAQSRGAIKASVAQEGKLRGWSPEMTDAMTREQLSKGHAAVIMGALQAGKTEYAGEYLKQVNTELTDTARLQLTGHVKDVDVQVRGDQAATDAWNKFAPADANSPVRLYDMEQALREKYQGEPKLREVALSSLKQRAAAFNAQQAEVNAGNINAVYGMVDARVPLSQIQRSPQWLSLPEAKRHDVVKGLEAEAATRAARAASESSRALTEMTRKNQMALLTNAGDYLHDSDPDRLASMPRAQVEALRTKYGFEGTQHLLTKWESLQQRGNKAEAKIDTDDFNHVADQLGLKPYAKDSSEDHKRQLGELKFRVEQLIDQAQGVKKAPLSRDEKQQLMRTEMARQVSVSTWLGASSDRVPVIQLKPEQVAKVRVPDADREQIVEALRQAYKTNPVAAYEPTEDNIRRLYLRGKSPAAGLISPSK